MPFRFLLILIIPLLFKTYAFAQGGNNDQPNIIFILTDDQRWNALCHSGNDIIQTPEMDKLAESGAYFRNAIVTTPICAASRASILSGVHERTHKYTFQTGGILEEYMVDSYPLLLRKAGYYTGFYGKFGVNYSKTNQLFDVMENYDRNNRYPDYRGYYYKTLDKDTVHLTRYTGQKALGNTELIEKYYERLKVKTLMELEVEDGFISIQSSKHNPEFLLRLGFPDTTTRLRDIVDWPPEAKNFGGVKGYQKGERDGYVFKRINTVVNGFYYHNMKIMAQFATAINKPAEALDFEFRAAKVKKSINELLFNEEKGYYVDGVGTDHGSLHANMILMAFDIVPESRKQSVIKHVKSRGMACSVYGSQYLLEALYKAGEDKYAHELMAATHDRSWYNMIKIGSTITLEAWDMKYKVNADWNHAWGATPANIISRYLWGIQPQAPGYSMASIKPQMGNLKSSTIEVPTIKGTIKGKYTFVNNRLQTYTIDVPANMVAEFEIDASDNKIIRLNGENVNLAFGSIRLLPGVNQIELVVNSF